MTSPRERYQADLKRADFTRDAAQAQAVEALQQVYESLLANPPRRRLFGGPVTWPVVQGLYMWGGVGRGKTYLMDGFFQALPFAEKRRTHFHRFMLDVHARRAKYPSARDPLQKIADDIADEVRVLCFDEFFVADIADAMILGRLFEALFARGVALVATSNLRPDDLYRDGLQRQNFLPAIERLKRNVRVLNVDGGMDHRMRTLHGVELYLAPCDALAIRRLDERFDALSPHGGSRHTDLEINSRSLRARRLSESLVWFDFETLCDGPRSAADYIALAREYNTVILSDVPQLDSSSEDAARRFITLIDEFYDHGVKLLIAAAVPMEQLYVGSRLRFEFQRTLSRLHEMQSEEYLAVEHRG